MLTERYNWDDLHYAVAVKVTQKAGHPPIYIVVSLKTKQCILEQSITYYDKPQTEIALVGGMGTGKTTVLEACKQKHAKKNKIAFVEDAGRLLLTREPHLDRTTTDTQLRIMELQFTLERQAHASEAHTIICDGSMITAIAHMYVYQYRKEANKQLERIQFWLPSYDKFFLFDPKDIPYQKDLIRTEEESFRDKLHASFIHILTQGNIPFEIIHGTVAEKCKLIEELCQ